MPGVSAQEKMLVKSFLGPWLIGSCLDLLLMGSLLGQFVHYHTGYPNDGRLLRSAATILCLLNLLKSAECFATLWIFLINHFGDIEYDLKLSTIGWWDTANPLMVAVLNFYVQCFFCARLWAVSKRWWVVTPIFILFVFALVSMILGTHYIANTAEQQTTDWSGDVILSVTMASFLIRTKNTVLSTRATELIDSLVALTLETATPPAVVAMLNLIFSQMYRTDHPLLGYVEIAFNQALPKMYAISMMYTLNVRSAIRSNNMAGSCISGVSGNHASGSRNESGSDRTSLGGRVKLRRTMGDLTTEMELARIEITTKA
ncbi:hypothetical protein B0H12DRAFT_1079175 [Mycena haematopus]|nr:hypothetical protein B0H12DRAFT_1079175 [Mycena haematopus]